MITPFSPANLIRRKLSETDSFCVPQEGHKWQVWWVRVVFFVVACLPFGTVEAAAFSADSGRLDQQVAGALLPDASRISIFPALPTVTVTAVVPKASESGRRPGRFRIKRTGPLPAEEMTLRVSGSATAGSDYVELPTAVEFGADEAEVDLEVRPLTDEIKESAESVILIVEAPTYYFTTKAGRKATVVISDNLPANYTHKLPGADKAFVYRRLAISEKLISWNSPERWVRLVAKGPTILNATLHGRVTKVAFAGNFLSTQYETLKADLRLELYDSAGEVLAFSDHPGRNAEFLRRVSLPAAGDYFLRVINIDPDRASTEFWVSLSGGMEWDIVENLDDENDPNDDSNPGDEAHHVGVVRADGRLKRVVSGDGSWLLIHGRASKPKVFVQHALNVTAMDPGARQALLLDWTTAAWVKSPVDASGGRWFQQLGRRIAKRLMAMELTGERLNVAAHSWGTFIGYEIGANIGGEDAIDRFVALDPAVLAENYDADEIDFRPISTYSWGIYTSGLGNAVLTRRTDDSLYGVALDGPDDGRTQPNPTTLLNLREILKAVERHSIAHLFFEHIFRNSSGVLATSLAEGILERRAAGWQRNPTSFNRTSANGAVKVLQPAVVPKESGYEGILFLNESGKPTRLQFGFAAPVGAGEL